MKTILTYGTFDLFHVGHLRLLKNLNEKSNGGRLIVGVSTDIFNERKGKTSLIPFEQRVEIMSAIKHVDLVIEENDWDQKIGDIQLFDVDIFAIGEDWTGKFDYLSEFCEVAYLPRTDGISTTELKASLDSFLSIEADDMLKTYEVLKRLYTELR